MKVVHLDAYRRRNAGLGSAPEPTISERLDELTRLGRCAVTHGPDEILGVMPIVRCAAFEIAVSAKGDDLARAQAIADRAVHYHVEALISAAREACAAERRDVMRIVAIEADQLASLGLPSSGRARAVSDRAADRYLELEEHERLANEALDYARPRLRGAARESTQEVWLLGCYLDTACREFDLAGLPEEARRWKAAHARTAALLATRRKLDAAIELASSAARDRERADRIEANGGMTDRRGKLTSSGVRTIKKLHRRALANAEAARRVLYDRDVQALPIEVLGPARATLLAACANARWGWCDRWSEGGARQRPQRVGPDPRWALAIGRGCGEAA